MPHFINSDKSVENRLRQLILPLIDGPFTEDIRNGQTLVTNVLIIDSHKKITLRFKHHLKNIFSFISLSALIFLKIVFKNNSHLNNKKFKIVYGCPKNVPFDNIFNYVEKVMKIDSTYVVFHDATNNVKDNYSTHRFPLLFPIDNISKGEFLLDFFQSFFSYFYLIIKYPILSLLAKDLPWAPLATCLCRNNVLDEVIITTSFFSNQPLWMTSLSQKNFDLSMMWYSINCSGVYWHEYNNEKLFSLYPGYYLLNIDKSYDWFESFHTKISPFFFKKPYSQVVGPNLFYLPNIETINEPNDRYFVIFDITPVSRKWASQNGIPFLYNNREVMIQFIEDIVSTCKQLSPETKIYLKHKREYHPIHSKEYIDFIKKMEDSQCIEIVNPDTDIFQLIQSSKICFCTPYTSPGYIADFLNIPSIYHDPTGLIEPHFYYSSTRLTLSSTKDDLKKSIQSYIAKST